MLTVAFYSASAIALGSTVMVVVNTNPVHALLYLVVSLLAVATVCFTLGAPFAGALEVIIYAGAIMVLFVFVVMTLNLGEKTVAQEREWMTGRRFVGPMLLSAVLLAELVVILWPHGELTPAGAQTITPRMVGIALYGPYLLIVELASMLLLGGLVAAYHLGRHQE
jgi:NADH-quinone oxidoreductase subunit J